MDGTFTKEIFSLTILLAVSVDADNHAVPIAWAIVEGESESSWRFFLSNLVTAIPEINTPVTTLMSDRDKGLRAADDEIPLCTRAICLEHLSRNLQTQFGKPTRTLFNSKIRFTRSAEKFEAGMAELQEETPRAAAYLRDIDLSLWSTPHFPGRRYGHTTSNIVEVMNNWLLKERRLAILDLLHAIWTKVMDLRYRRLKETGDYPQGVVLTKYSTKLLQESMHFVNHQAIRLADQNRGSVLSFMGKWYVVDLEEHTCSCGRFQFHDVPCGHAIAIIQAANRGAPRNFIPYNLTVAAMIATYATAMPPIDIANLEIRRMPLGEDEWAGQPLCRPPLFKKPRGRPQTARLTAGEQRARRAELRGALDVPDRVQRCSRCRGEGHNVRNCRALPPGL
jgi:hypothetical protein